MHPRWGLVLLALVLVVAGCSNSPNTAPSKGSLEIVVQGISEAPVEVAAGGKSVFSGKVSGSKLLAGLEPGTYIVDGAQVKNFRDPPVATVEIKNGSSAKVTLVYEQQAPPSAPVAKLEVIAVRDAAGGDLPSNKEVNDNKNVNLYASQTEEPVCVSVRATDAGGAPVANASIVVNVSELFGNNVAILRGCAKGLASSMAFRDGIFTDPNGQGSFTLYATRGTSPSGFDSELLLFDEPAKVVVGAENSDNTTRLSEFKVFFYNISHLYFGNTPTKQRTGATFTEQNLFKPLGDRIDRNNPADNDFLIRAGLYTKQPQTAVRLPSGSLDFTFELLDGAGKVNFVNCDNLMKPTLCEDPDGSVDLQPNDSLGLRDLPLSARVKVTLWVVARYGETEYRWPLKDFTVNKTWIGTYLTISKTVDHHVLTWAGPEHHLNVLSDGRPKNRQDYTLDAANDPAVAPGSVFTATYTITITNAGTAPAYNVTLADALPAEIGVLTGTANPAGATYDATNHVITWNWQNTPDPRFDELAPGQSITGTVQVYVRQKPGFCWDDTPALGNDLQKAQTYQIKPLINVGRSRCSDTVDSGYDDPNGTRYNDPYKTIDGYFQQDVTSTWYTGAPLGKGGFQVKVDFNGAVNEKDVVIWAVRPRFAITKDLVDKSVDGLDVGHNPVYDITIRNIPLDTGTGRYAFLKTAYPNEFDGTTRDNPYGRNVSLADVMDNGLDFISSGPLRVSDDEGVTASADYASSWMPDKGIIWKVIPLLGGGDTGTARISLRTNLPGLWSNCGFLDADNLNQPLLDGFYPGGVDWRQIELRPWGPAPLQSDLMPDLRYGLRSCYTIRVVAPTQPWIHLDSYSEFTNANANDKTALAFNVKNGDTFYYRWSVSNVGSKTATGVSFKTDLSGTASFSSNILDHTVWISTDGGNTFAPLGVAATASASSVTFGALNVASGAQLVYIVKTSATGAGNASATSTVTYTNPEDQSPTLPLQTKEDTVVQP